MQNLVKLQSLELGGDGATGLAARIKELRAAIPVPILAHYDRLMVRGKKGAASVRNNVCRECHMTVAIGVMQTIRQGNDIQLCGNCGRYLYMEEEPAPPPVPEPPPEAPAKPKRRGRKKTKPDPE